jgi:hypothetical protein
MARPCTSSAGGLFVVHHAVVGVALEDDARGALPRHQPERPGAHRHFHRTTGVGFDHLARHGARQRRAGKHVGQARRRARGAHLEAVAVQRADAVDLDVVGEGLLVGQRLLAQFRQAQQAGVFVVEQRRAAHRRVVVALDRVDVVGGDQLAPLALEHRVVGEVVAGPQREHEACVVVADLGQATAAAGFRRTGRARYS